MGTVRTCRDVGYTGVDCCPVCHEYPDEELVRVLVDGLPVWLCCRLRRFFYPDHGDGKFLSPEERLLRAIFPEYDPHDPDND